MPVISALRRLRQKDPTSWRSDPAPRTKSNSRTKQRTYWGSLSPTDKTAAITGLDSLCLLWTALSMTSVLRFAKFFE